MTPATPPVIAASRGAASTADAVPDDGAPVRAIEHLLIRDRSGRVLLNRRIRPPAQPPAETPDHA